MTSVRLLVSKHISKAPKNEEKINAAAYREGASTAAGYLPVHRRRGRSTYKVTVREPGSDGETGLSRQSQRSLCEFLRVPRGTIDQWRN